PAVPWPPREGGRGAAGLLHRSLSPHIRTGPTGRGRPVPGHRDGRGARCAQPRQLLHRGAVARRLRPVPRLAPADGAGPLPPRPLLLLLTGSSPTRPPTHA